MYKFLLCWRYLRTRYIALASIISVMLGVATMIVVNAVMSGFAVEMQNRLHGILSDLQVDSTDLGGFPDAEGHMAAIRKIAGDAVEGMTPIVRVPAMLSYRYGDNWVNDQVEVIGIDAKTQGQVSDFSKYLQHPANRQEMSFQLRQGGFDTFDHQAGADALERPALGKAGWPYRRERVKDERVNEGYLRPKAEAPADPFAGKPELQGQQFDPTKDQHPGAVMGIALAMRRMHDGTDRFFTLPGDDISLTFPNAPAPGAEVKIVHGSFTLVDLYESKMSEFDSKLVFVPIEQLQKDRGMIDPQSGARFVNSIQIKLKPGVDGSVIRDRLAKSGVFPPDRYYVLTWRDRQGPLLAAVQMETAILNLLLFMIIAVSGFGILAIFFMIVVEKTRDIGILKSLGASRQGILAIFLSYGLALGIVGSGLGTIFGLLFVQYINPIADFVGWVRGQKVFDPSIYYFYKIPAVKDPWTVTWIVCGTLAIAVLASVLPALRAARLHPVEALRHE